MHFKFVIFFTAAMPIRTVFMTLSSVQPKLALSLQAKLTRANINLFALLPFSAPPSLMFINLNNYRCDRSLLKPVYNFFPIKYTALVSCFCPVKESFLFVCLGEALLCR